MKTDRFFGGPTNLLADSPLLTTAAEPHPAAAKAIELHKLGSQLRRIMADKKFRVPDLFPKRAFALLTPREQGLATFALLTTTGHQLDELNRYSPELGNLVTKFQALVPVTTPSKIQLLITTPDAQTKALEKAYALFQRGKIPLTQLTDVTKKITGLDVKDAAEIQSLTQERSNSDPKAAKWIFYGAGSESKAYQDGDGIVYKVAPINQAMLDILPIRDGKPLYPRMGAHLFANELNQLPILERSLASATIPGLAPTEIVAFTKDGDVVFKQVDFGNLEPTADELKDWAIRHGHIPLESQGEDPEKQFDNDTSVLPVVVQNRGQFHIILDLNPRNCRRVKKTDGTHTIVPFDIISRPLLPEEINAHPEIKEAVSRLRKNSDGHLPGQHARAILDAGHAEMDRFKKIVPTSLPPHPKPKKDEPEY